MRYHADITAGSLKIPESRIVADLLLRGCNQAAWDDAIQTSNLLQARSPATAKRIARLIRFRLQTMDAGLWRLVRNGDLVVTVHACLAAAVKHSALLGDFLDLVIREEYRLFSPALRPSLWERYLEDCRSRDSEMPVWSESTVRRLRSSVFHVLAQAGYIENTRTLKLQSVHIAGEVLNYLKANDEKYVLRCIQVGP